VDDSLNKIAEYDLQIDKLTVQKKEAINRLVESYHPLSIGDEVVVTGNIYPGEMMIVEERGITSSWNGWTWFAVGHVINVSHTASPPKVYWEQPVKGVVTSERLPLLPGTMIEFCGEEAEVVYDSGGSSLEVAIDGTIQKWRWELEGVQCSVISLPGESLQNTTLTTKEPVYGQQ
jgi:hypothetical protein